MTTRAEQTADVSEGKSSQGSNCEWTPDADAGEAKKHITMGAAATALTVVNTYPEPPKI